jgi:hypothetical protein
MNKKSFYLLAEAGVTLAGIGVGVSGQIQPNGKNRM